MATARTAPALSDIQAARARIEGIARVTPVFGSETFSRMAGREVQLKAENLQRTGAFKIRGAVNRISLLDETQRAAGVVTASAGNHGQAVAWAARNFGTPATIFMPQDSPMAKVDATRHYGAEVRLVGEGFEQAVEASRAFAEEAGATYVHAFEDEAVIAGQGTVGLELVEQLPQATTVVVPVGGGGLCAGIATAVKELRPGVRVVGVQAAACIPGPDGSPPSGFTIAEGIAVKAPGELTMGVLRDRLDDLVAVSDEEIAQAILLCLERVKQVVEGAGAAGVAALLAGRVAGTDPVAIVLSGGNIDPTLLISVMRHGLTVSGRYLVVRTSIPDRPGELARLLKLLGEERVNVVSVEHHREGMDLSLGETEVELTLLTRDQEHGDEIVATLGRWGYSAERLR